MREFAWPDDCPDQSPLSSSCDKPCCETHNWLARHGAIGILHDNEVAVLSESTRRVLHLLSDGAWHDANQIRAVAGGDGPPASEGLRRMRDLRPVLSNYSLQIVKARQDSSRLFIYRIEQAVQDTDSGG